MKKPSRIKIALICIFVAVAGTTVEVDYCLYTAANITRVRILGVPVYVSHDDGFRTWLENDVGVHLGSNFVNYVRFHPLFAYASTPPGNWLMLRSAKTMYDKHPEARSVIQELLKKVELRHPPRLGEREDMATLNQLFATYPN
jgi:hypothetical protein